MNFVSRLFGICLLLLACHVSARNADELYRKALSAPSAENWNRLARHLYMERKNPELLSQATQNAVRLARLHDDSLQWGEALIYASDLFYQKGEFQLYQDENRKALRLLRHTRSYELKEIALNNIATSFGEQDRIDSLIFYTRKAMALNRHYKGSAGRWGDECQNLSYAYSVSGMADSAYHYTCLTIEALTIAKDTLRLLDAYNQMAVFYVKKKHYPDALEYFTKALDLYAQVDNTHNRLYVYTNMAAMYHKWGKDREAIEFAQYALKDASGTAEKATYGKLLCNMGLYLYSDGRFRESVDTLLQALPLVGESFYYWGTACQALANNYEQLGMPDSCEYFLSEVDSLADTNRFIRSELFYAAKVALLVHRQKYKEAAVYANRFVEIDRQKELTESSPYIYDMISLALEKGGDDYRTALDYKRKAAAMQDTLYQRETNRQMVEYYARFQMAKKDMDIAMMKMERKQVRQKWLLLAGGSMLAMAMLGMQIFYQRMKRLAKEKEAAELYARIRQKEQELDKMGKEMHSHALRSYFEGAETERKRLAKELHDNVANGLLGIRMLMKIHPEDVEEASRNLEELHEEVRAISHSLIPPTFREVTLTEILNEHIYRLNMGKDCRFELSLPDEEKLDVIDENMSLTIYRIVQELCGNIVKHSLASLTIVEISLSEHSVFLSVTDNGMGFDRQKVTRGVGLRFVRSRVEEFDGSFQLDTEVGKGCRVEITFPLQA